MSRSPRTDAVWERIATDLSLEPDVEFSTLARELEYELNETERLASIRLNYTLQLEAEKEAANIRIKRLEKAGDRLLTVMRGEEGTAYCEWVGLAYDAEQNWLKAKEDKP